MHPCIWSPYKLQYIDKIDSIQKLFTKRLNDLQCDVYSVRLSKLSFDSLELRRLLSYLLMIFDIIHGFVEVDISNLLHFSTATYT